MIFALADYLKYVRRTAHYSRDVTKSIMGGAFQCESPPPQVVHLLKPGDVLIVQTLDSPISWLIMYLTTSDISHVAAYAGDSKVFHSTSSGVTVEPIEVLFDQNTRVLPTSWDMPEEDREKILERMTSLLGTPYGWSVVIRKGLMIVSGRDWPYFRLRFAVDLMLTLLILDGPFLLLLNRPVVSWLIPIYATLICFNSLRWKVSPLKFNEDTGKPCDMYTIVKKAGGTFFYDAHEMYRQMESRKKSAP